MSDARWSNHVVVHIDLQLSVFDYRREKRSDVARVKLARVYGHSRGKIGRREDTLVLAQTTATNPSIVLVVLCPAPAVTIDPTSEMPEIAFVADISGVCSNGGTREITW